MGAQTNLAQKGGAQKGGERWNPEGLGPRRGRVVRRRGGRRNLGPTKILNTPPTHPHTFTQHTSHSTRQHQHNTAQKNRSGFNTCQQTSENQIGQKWFGLKRSLPQGPLPPPSPGTPPPAPFLPPPPRDPSSAPGTPPPPDRPKFRVFFHTNMAHAHLGGFTSPKVGVQGFRVLGLQGLQGRVFRSLGGRGGLQGALGVQGFRGLGVRRAPFVLGPSDLLSGVSPSWFRPHPSWIRRGSPNCAGASDPPRFIRRKTASGKAALGIFRFRTFEEHHAVRADCERGIFSPTQGAMRRGLTRTHSSRVCCPSTSVPVERMRLRLRPFWANPIWDSPFLAKMSVTVVSE